MVEVERAATPTGGVDHAVEAGLADLKDKLDRLNHDIENLVANSEEELQKAEKQIEERLEVLNKKSRELSKEKSKAAAPAEGSAPEDAAPEDDSED